ncbi:hypothetical protein Dvina_34240 [Dactylosporangium vinaceum]|uniref:NACHT domain-containing protein n=1 Tax=Dactylosporangium vinaceum TaxID=53362 RepID=A0ABV5MM98_9ACTN|nr:hypothetical protein [Dactylosporangium vinaceum]UAB93306.1 hypothetical protein Dvina_34240 [Dactylosporangium vinaceum]
MSRSHFSFAQALKLIGEHGASTALDRLLGTALFAGAAVSGPAALVVLSLVDPKNEATKLLSGTVDTLAAKARGTSGRTRQDLLMAAHTITVLSAFFDALVEHTGTDLPDDDKRRLAELHPQLGFVDQALNADVPFPSAEHPLLDNLHTQIRPLYTDLAQQSLEFLSGLEGFHGPAGPAPVVERAAALYLDRMLQLGPEPPFALWLTLTEHGATHHALGALEQLLRQVAAGTAPTAVRASLATHARAVLDERLLRTGGDAVLTPTIRDGFVEPAFRHVRYDADSLVSASSWWGRRPVREGLVDFLAAHLASAVSAELPLLVLGDPGAGKSLLTEVLAARLPAESFAVLRVPLREVNPGDRLHEQITKHLRRTLQTERIELQDVRTECGPCIQCRAADRICWHQARMVVLLDGFDELVQATGITQSGYLEDVKTFQKDSRVLGVPVAVIVTSRTLVAERAEIPNGAPIVRLERFDKPRIKRWTTAWNTARAGADGFVPLSSQALLTNSSVAELVRDPLLLLVLAIYLAELGQPGFGTEALTPAQLYRRLLDTFIERQVDKDETDLSADERARRQRTQRRELQLTAFGMFNRGRQHITHDELDSDLAALIKAPKRGATLAEQLTEAQRVLSEFLFLHNATIRDQRGVYEFLHATFGEYLVAELITTELARLTRLCDVDEDARLDDARLCALLSHEPITQRAPILRFAREQLTESPVKVLEKLIRDARYRPDSAEGRYLPVSYDPVRRRAAYLANLVLLRVHLDDQPVPTSCLADSAESWAATVGLWRAGLPDASWVNVMGALRRMNNIDAIEATKFTDNPSWSADSREADLAGNRYTAAARAIGDRFARPSETWTGDDLDAHEQTGKLLAFPTAAQATGQLLPYDLDFLDEFVAFCNAASSLNTSSRRQIGRILARDARNLPSRLVEQLAAHAIPGSSSAELAAAVAAHPKLLNTVPGLREAVSADPAEFTDVVAALWAAESRAAPADAGLLHDLRCDIDRTVRRTLDLQVDSVWFSPAYLTYLRCARPSHWTEYVRLRERINTFRTSHLRRIAPEDGAFLAGDDGAIFAGNYLRSRGVDFEDGGEIAALREYAERERSS